MTSLNHNKGVRGEQLTADELLRQGYHVYSSLTFHAPFDLVAEKDGQLFRVEVKARYTFDHHLEETMSHHTGKFDILAIVNLNTKHVQFRHNATCLRPCGEEGLPIVKDTQEAPREITPAVPPAPKVGEKNYWGDTIYALVPEED